MGDCRIRIQVKKSLLSTGDGAESGGDDKKKLLLQTIIDRIFSSDSTIREVVEAYEDGLVLNLLTSGRASLWNCTVYPSRDITRDFLQCFPDQEGSKSLTLYSAGWFPSASLQCLPLGESPLIASSDAHDDVQYNARQQGPLHSSDQQVVWTKPLGGSSSSGTGSSSSRPLPSQILNSVKDRETSSYNIVDDQETRQAQFLRQENKRTRQEKEQKRLERLQERIQKLESKQSGTLSAQVLKMLIKSRATGRKEVQMPDRLHFKCLIDYSDTEEGVCQEDYRYFSRQDTIGKALSSFSSPNPKLQPEFLVVSRITSSSPDSSPPNCYIRLPALLRFYEAMDAQYLSNFDTVIIRFYDPREEDATTSVEEKCEPRGETVAADVISKTSTKPDNDSTDEKVEESSSSSSSGKTSGDCGSSSLTVTLPQLSDAIEQFEASQTKTKSRKPASAASLKVKQMQMKSRAKGDVKRVKLQDRFFLELVVATRDGGKLDSIISIDPIFMAKTDSFARIPRDCVPHPPSSFSSWELLAPDTDGGSFYRIIDDPSMSLNQASQRSIIPLFGRIILRYTK